MDVRAIFPLGMTPGAVMAVGGAALLSLGAGFTVWIMATAGKRRRKIVEQMRNKY
ncbi:MAG: hypothetical protein HFG72_10725 [Hungatella sp.]|jgi:hypothetical protein|nr:hypothetical protein [Hungatella sp.]